VLSACMTNVGLQRAGQGIHSLQSAIDSAGARSSITSLWRMDDAASTRLMTEFYRLLWKEKQPKAEALWRAKQILRKAGSQTRDWAAWVLVGDPK
jgi:CHAT domain-containing protein